jgi:hypothetical protein
MNGILLKIIVLLHILLILFVVITPFLSNNYLLFMHFVFVPFMILHWIINDNTCVLTVIERKIRKDVYGEKDDDNCFTCKLIEPVYDFRKNYKTCTILIYLVTISLWLISTGKLYYGYRTGTISSFRDIFNY